MYHIDTQLQMEQNQLLVLYHLLLGESELYQIVKINKLKMYFMEDLI